MEFAFLLRPPIQSAKLPSAVFNNGGVFPFQPVEGSEVLLFAEVVECRYNAGPSANTRTGQESDIAKARGEKF